MIRSVLAALNWLFWRGKMPANANVASYVSHYTGLTEGEVEAEARKLLERKGVG